jgi:hypothetical protein
MVPVIGVLVSIVLYLAKFATLTWVFFQTRRLAAIIYLTCLVINWLFSSVVVGRVVNSLQNNGGMLWLGATSGERVSNFLFLARFIPASIESLLFVWLLISLTRRSS